MKITVNHFIFKSLLLREKHTKYKRMKKTLRILFQIPATCTGTARQVNSVASWFFDQGITISQMNGENAEL